MIDNIPIDPGEVLLARTGIGHALARSDKPLWLRKTAVPLEDAVAAKARAFISGERDAAKATLSELDYEKVLDQIVAAQKEAPSHGGFEKLDGDTISGYLVAVTRAIQYLDKVIPRAAVKDMIGSRNLPPSDLQLSKFRRVWGVAQDPMTALNALVNGTLVKDQAIALQVMFPGIFAVAKAVIWDAVVDARAANIKWTLPFAKDSLLQTFLLVTPDNAAALKRLQQNFADAKERQGQQADDSAQSKPAPGAKLAAAFETPVQRAAT